ncbi:MAG TPA: hypothetical protein VH084_27115, partial [Mycobacterium sp.]|nr:hypothetical protein [Mycobacterium sp.]
MDLTSTFAPITKTVDQDDGSLLVYGKATDDSLDLDDQRCDAAWLKTAMPEWFQWGNIREQHRADSAIGKAIEHEAIDGDGHYITARIVDPLAVAKTKAGIFTGFSIGINKPKIVRSPRAPKGLINGGMITEVSLVDRPANSNAILTLCKAAQSGWEGSGADLDLDRGLVRCEEMEIDEEGLAKAMRVTVTKGVESCCGDCTGEGCDGECCGSCPMAKKTAAKTVVVLDEDAISAKISKAIAEANEALADAISRQPGAALKEAISPEPFDREKAIALVKALGDNESPDITGAESAISTIARLIISEAQDLAKMPSQDCDIHLLMGAVDALRCFVRREQMEQADVDPDGPIQMAVDSDLAKGKYSAEQLRSMLAAGKAMKNPQGEPSYPIGDKEDLSNAIHAVGRGSGSHDSIRAYIKRRAKALGASDMIPDSWSGSSKAADTDVAKEGNQTMTVDAAEAPDVEKTIDTDVTPDAPETDAAPEGDAVPETENKSVEPDAPEASASEDAPEGDVDKSANSDEDTSVEPDLTKAVGAVVTSDFLSKALEEHPDILIKAFKDALDNEKSDLRKMIVDITEASTKSAAKALGDELGARLEKVEAMATPGGPSLR